MTTSTIVCVLASLFTAAPAVAQSGTVSIAPPPAPVTISACRGGINSIELVEIATYDVTFRNTTAVPVDELRLSARYGRHEKRAAFDLKGPFAPGVDVSRHLRRTVSGGLFANWSDQNDCTVDYVRFANGTTWSRPAPAASR
jgi:hypothetical protein